MVSFSGNNRTLDGQPMVAWRKTRYRFNITVKCVMLLTDFTNEILHGKEIIPIAVWLFVCFSVELMHYMYFLISPEERGNGSHVTFKITALTCMYVCVAVWTGPAILLVLAHWDADNGTLLRHNIPLVVQVSQAIYMVLCIQRFIPWAGLLLLQQTHLTYMFQYGFVKELIQIENW